MITAVWLNGKLSGMADPESYPTLSELLGDPDPDPEPDDTEVEPEAQHIGARLWVMHLNRGSSG